MVSKYVYTPLHPKISLSSANTRQPTWGTVSAEGTGIVSVSADTPGFYARSVDDLEFLAHLFRLDSLLTEPLHPLSIIGARIAFVKTHIWPEAQSGTRAAWNLAHRLLAETGAKVEHVELPERFGSCPEWREIVVAEETRAAYLPSASILSVSGPVLSGLVNLSLAVTDTDNDVQNTFKTGPNYTPILSPSSSPPMCPVERSFSRLMTASLAYAENGT